MYVCVCVCVLLSFLNEADRIWAHRGNMKLAGDKFMASFQFHSGTR